MTQHIFITATDTDAGKTLIACAITAKLTAQNAKVAVFKPISAGCNLINGQLINDDAQQLKSCANMEQSIDNINPIAFFDPIAPHIAAQHEKVFLNNALINDKYRDVTSLNPEYLITEGAGGWRLPLGNGEYLSGFAKQQQCKVILVVNMKLGCLNHAILTYESILNDGLQVIGWVANCIDEMPSLNENIDLLTNVFDAKLLGVVGKVSSAQEAAKQLTINIL